MKKLLPHASFLIICALVLYFAYVNFNNTVPYICPFDHKTYVLSLGLIIAIVLALSTLAGAIQGAVMIMNYKETNKRDEGLKIKSEEDSDRIKTLEAKIATLEAALKSALDKK